MGDRPMGIRKARYNPWRYDATKPWVWECRICRLECTYPAATLAGVYANAVEHLEEEHLGRLSISEARDYLLNRLEPIYREAILSRDPEALLEQIAPGSTKPVEPRERVINRDKLGV